MPELIEIYWSGDNPFFEVNGLPFGNIPRGIAYDSETKQYYLLHGPEESGIYEKAKLNIGRNRNMQNAEIKKSYIKDGKFNLEYLLNGNEETISFPIKNINFCPEIPKTTILKKEGKEKNISTQWIKLI